MKNNNSSKEKVVKQFTTEQKMTMLHLRMHATILFGCVGWAVFWAGIFGSQLGSFWYVVVALIGAVLTPGPLLYRMTKGGGLMKAFDTGESYTVTTYSDGSKTTEYDTTGNMIGMMLKFFWWCLLIFLGGIMTIIYMLYMIIRYTLLYLKIEVKPVFMKSAFPIMILCVIFLLTGIIVVGLIFQRLVKLPEAVKWLLFAVYLAVVIVSLLKFKATEPVLQETEESENEQ